MRRLWAQCGRPRTASRRAAALLIALACVVVVTIACGAVAGAATWAEQSRSGYRRAEIARELVRSADGPIRRWLNHESVRVVLPPDASTPEVSVFNDEWRTPHEALEVRVTGYDECGMVPLGHLDVFESAVPESIREIVGSMSLAAPGLDCLGDAARARGLRVIPSPGGTTKDAAVGAVIATHDPATRRAGSPVLVNVATAPRAYLEVAMRAASVIGIDQIMQARAAGRRPTIQGRTDGDTPIELAAVSTAWAFRVDVRVGALNKSWWVVYVRSAAGWEMVQRHAIDE